MQPSSPSTDLVLPYLDGSSGEAQVSELLRRLPSEPELAERLVIQSRLTAMLIATGRHESRRDEAEAVLRHMDVVELVEEGPVESPGQPRIAGTPASFLRSLRRGMGKGWVAAAAAALLALAGIALYARWMGGEPPAQNPVADSEYRRLDVRQVARDWQIPLRDAPRAASSDKRSASEPSEEGSAAPAVSPSRVAAEDRSSSAAAPPPVPLPFDAEPLQAADPEPAALAQASEPLTPRAPSVSSRPPEPRATVVQPRVGPPAARSTDEPPAAAAPTPRVIARLESVRGNVYLLGREPSEKTPARAGGGIAWGAGLVTEGQGSAAVVTFPDSTRLEVSADSTLSRLSDGDEPNAAPTSDAKGKYAFLSQGTVTASVADQAKDRALRLDTPHARVEVLGTRYTLACGPDATTLKVWKGAVRFTRVFDGQAITVKAGYQAAVDRRLFKSDPAAGDARYNEGKRKKASPGDAGVRLPIPGVKDP